MQEADKKDFMKRKSIQKLRSGGGANILSIEAAEEDISEGDGLAPVPLRSGPSAQWNALPWRSLDVSKANLGDFEDSVFFGLEELDGNAYKLTKSAQSYKIESVAPAPAAPQAALDLRDQQDKKPKRDRKDQQGKKKRKLQEREAEGGLPTESKQAEVAAKRSKQAEQQAPAEEAATTTIATAEATWGTSKISLDGLLVRAVLALNFAVPTPIQEAAIPATLRGRCDLVGAAETGSGKTLAFCLPVLHCLLHDWPELEARPPAQRCPYALVLSPTRELALQISSVLREVCAQLRRLQPLCRVEVVTIVGGMSEQKQRRQLSGEGRPVHILVATPGRLCDMVQVS